MTDLRDLGMCLDECGRRFMPQYTEHQSVYPSTYESGSIMFDLNPSPPLRHSGGGHHGRSCNCMQRHHDLMKMLIMLIALDTAFLLYLLLRR